MSDNDSFLTREEVQKLLKVKRATFEKMITRGQVPGVVQLGPRTRLFHRPTLERVLAERAAAASSR